MADDSAEAVKALIANITELENEIATAGDIGRKEKDDLKVADVRNIVESNGIFDSAKWDALTETARKELENRLTQIRDALNQISGHDGPKDPMHIMHATYASNFWIAVLCLLAGLLTAGLLWLVVDNWNSATGSDRFRATGEARTVIAELDATTAAIAKAEDTVKIAELAEINASAKDKQAKAAAAKKAKDTAAEARTRRDQLQQKAQAAALQAIRAIKDGVGEAAVLRMVVLLGALGGAVHMTGSLAKYIGQRRLMRSWLIFYVSMPIAGAALAPIVYMLLRVGILSPAQAGSDGSAIAGLNLIAIYAFAALTGMFAKTATDKLAEVFQTIFRTARPPAKDALSANTKSGSTG